ncbi:hypothetical protein DEU56DRAFT_202050 [Suillus clintonianus]|uniref:uncharacterized protein n=1 Tax=Suillus clintonianus TaxID=1904413 RepID=UPI001B8746E2|nr:uncharacterized protein DEU56DRAFT_202050 [Suillus clintonianus]KAG2112421.1 hypothetical protein DEU56DRAFT_202050 [Suillus clintonianus]
MQAEIPGQDQDGYDAEPDFFRGMHGHSQISRPRPQQRPGHFKKLRFAMTKNPHPAPPPASPAAATSNIKAQLKHLFTWRSDHAAPSVVDVPFAKGKERNAAADDPGPDKDMVPDEYFDDLPQSSDTQQPNTQQQQVVKVGTGDHGGGKSCFCC